MLTDKNADMAPGLHELHAADFKKFTGEEFLIHFATGAIPAQLKTVTDLTGYSNLERKPFSLLFQTLQTNYFPQAIYRVDHPGIGVLDIFLVPLGVREGGMQYEAIFS